MSLPATLEPNLHQYDLGNKIRQLRRRKRMRLVDVQQHTGLSASLISKLESSKLIPTLPTLLRLATIFNVGLDFFFAEEERNNDTVVIRGRDRVRLTERFGGEEDIYTFESLNFGVPEPPFDVFLGEIVSESTHTRFHHHPGYELLYVLSGELEIRTGEQTQTLTSGDSIYFDSSRPHSYRKTSPGKCSVFVVVTQEDDSEPKLNGHRASNSPQPIPINGR